MSAGDRASTRAVVESLRAEARHLSRSPDAKDALRLDALVRVIDDMEAEAGIGGSFDAQWRLLDRRLRELWAVIRTEATKDLRRLRGVFRP